MNLLFMRSIVMTQINVERFSAKSNLLSWCHLEIQYNTSFVYFYSTYQGKYFMISHYNSKCCKTCQMWHSNSL